MDTMNEDFKMNLLELWKSNIPENMELALMLCETLDASSPILNEFIVELKRTNIYNVIQKDNFKTEEEFEIFVSKINSKIEGIFQKHYIKQIDCIKTVNIDNLLNEL